MIRLHLFNRLEQLRHIDQRLSNQSIFIPYLKPIEPRATPIVVRQVVTNPQITWHVRPIPSLGGRSQVPHHKPVSKGNQTAISVTYTYCHQMGHLFNCYPFVDDRLT